MRAAALALPLLTAACATGMGGGSSSGSDPADLYVALLTTTRTRLDGTNPPVGVFRSTNGGGDWEHLGWEQGKAFAVLPLSDTLVVAQGNGVHLSEDGGRSWRIVTDWRVTEVQDVAPDPGAPGRLFAATPYGVFRSDDLGGAWAEASRGLDSPDATFVSTIRADRAAAGRLLIGTEAGLFVSDDAGVSWRPLPVPEPVRAVRQSPHDTLRWAAALQGKGLALSEDGGVTWGYATGLPEGTTVYEVEWDPYEPGVLWAGGWKTGVVRSLDAGRAWAVLGLSETSVHGIAIAAPGVVLVGTMGDGVFRTRDGGLTWEAVGEDVFAGGQVWDVAREGEW